MGIALARRVLPDKAGRTRGNAHRALAEGEGRLGEETDEEGLGSRQEGEQPWTGALGDGVRAEEVSVLISLNGVLCHHGQSVNVVRLHASIPWHVS
jgi:hypothetical protein